MKQENRETTILSNAVVELRRHYPSLDYSITLNAIKENVKIPNTGDAQADFDSTKIQVEAIAKDFQEQYYS